MIGPTLQRCIKLLWEIHGVEYGKTFEDPEGLNSRKEILY